MFRQSVLLANLVLVSLISFSACEPLRQRRESEVGSSDPLPPKDPRCEGRKLEDTWKEDCNTCFCGPNGLVGCTRMACPKVPHTGQDVRCAHAKENETISWKEDCNTCFCAAEGVPACTRKLCVPTDAASRAFAYGVVYSAPGAGLRSEAPGAGVRSEAPGAGLRSEAPGAGLRSAAPGAGLRSAGDEPLIAVNQQPEGVYASDPEVAAKATGEDSRCLNSNLTVSWKDDCNTCFCVAEGVPACTLMACFPKDTDLSSPPSEQPAANKVKRDTKELVDAFSADEEQADAPYPHRLMSSASDVYPGVWSATAALSAITAVLARM